MEALGGPWLNLTNSYSVAEAERLGLGAVTCSIEEKLDAARNLRASVPLGAVVYGKLPLMSFRSCPVKAQIGCEKCRRRGYLIDRRGNSFPVRCDQDKSVSFLYNTMPLILSDREREIQFFDFWLFDFTLEEESEVRDVVRQYREGIRTPGDCTRGLYYRGIDG